MSLSIFNKENFPPPSWGRIGGGGYFKYHPPLTPPIKACLRQAGRGSSEEINKIILQALREDAFQKDITTKLFIPQDKISEGYIVAKEETALCGLDIARSVFQKLDKNFKFTTPFKDGQKVKAHTKIAFLKGKAQAILTAERTALNFLGYLSGISTSVNQFVQATRPFKTILLDTRKTTPGLRILEKYAVRCGGARNHRLNLEEFIFLKDNHKKCFPHFKNLVVKAGEVKRQTKKTIAIEVETLNEFKEALEAQVDIILLDNFTTSQLKKCVKMIRMDTGIRRRPLLEASGGITLKNIRVFAKTGVDRISIGALTHAHRSIDFSLEIIK